jgi:hypothetical protein
MTPIMIQLGSAGFPDPEPVAMAVMGSASLLCALFNDGGDWSL